MRLSDKRRVALHRRDEIEALIERDFIQFDPHYKRRRAELGRRLARLEERLVGIEAGGNAMPCSNQLFVEAKWLLQYTARWADLEAQLARLAASLEDPDQGAAALQSPADGAWGPCYSAWFLKLDATLDGLNRALAAGQVPAYPLSFLARIGTPQALQNYLDEIQTSEIARDGIDRRDELGAVEAALSQMLFKKDLLAYIRQNVRGFTVTDAYIAAYRAFLEATQDAATGFWGAWFRSADVIHTTADLSLTFHTVSYTHGGVPRMPQIVATLFAIKDHAYPYGWLHDGALNNHNDYDVATILRWGWQGMADDERSRASTEIAAMLAWCRERSMRPDGSFIMDPSFYNSLGDCYYFGVAFLEAVGFWDKNRRFWTDRDFPEAHEICCRIKQQVVRLGSQSDSAQAALDKLNTACPDC